MPCSAVMTAAVTLRQRVRPNLLGIALVACLTGPGVPARAACPPEGWQLTRLQSLKAERWKLDDEAERTRVATELLDCLGHHDPVLRDDLAFEALSTWLRGGALTLATARELGTRLVDMMLLPDAAGFGAPFAVLALAEVARVDRLSAIWTPEERQGIVDVAAQWMRSINDYRGFEPGAGWRHAVAHGADLLMQLALNPALERAQLDRLLDAVASQVLAASGHAYVHGESERLVRPVVFIARRGLHNEAEWTAWFGRIAAAARGDGATTTLAGLARRHNAKAFFYPLYAAMLEGNDVETRKRLLPGLVAALRALN